MKKTWAIRKDSEAVSPVIATILMVAITVVLAAVLYVMVLGFGGTSTTTPAATYQKTTTTGGVKILIVSVTKTDVSWDDIKVQLSAGGAFAEWSPVATDLDGGSAVSQLYTSSTGTLAGFNCTVYDLGGNGVLSGSDYIILLGTFSGSYTAALIYVPTGEMMGTGATFAM